MKMKCQSEENWDSIDELLRLLVVTLVVTMTHSQACCMNPLFLLILILHNHVFVYPGLGLAGIRTYSYVVSC